MYISNDKLIIVAVPTHEIIFISRLRFLLTVTFEVRSHSTINMHLWIERRNIIHIGSHHPHFVVTANGSLDIVA